MSCAQMNERILPYADGRLNGRERREFEKHVAACSSCRLRVEEFQKVSGLLGELPLVEPSPAFDVRVRARVAAEPPRQSWWAWLAPSPRVALAASMLVLALAWISHRPGDPAILGPSSPEAEYRMINDLPVLEDYDVVSSFEPLTDLPEPVQNDDANQSM